MDHMPQGGSNKTILPNSPGQTRDKNKFNPKACSCAVGTRENGGISSRLHLRDDARCSCGQGDQTMDYLLFHCTRNSTQQELLKHQISKQRNWPESKQELISKYRKLFSAFIEYIDFELIQQSDAN